MRAAESTAICSELWTEMAYTLFSIMKMTGSLWMAAQFTASYHSPCEVDPSPMLVSTTAFSPRSLIPSPIPEACGAWVATGEEWLTTFALRRLQWLGIWRAPEVGSPFFPINPSMKSSGV